MLSFVTMIHPVSLSPLSMKWIIVASALMSFARLLFRYHHHSVGKIFQNRFRYWELPYNTILYRIFRQFTVQPTAHCQEFFVQTFLSRNLSWAPTALRSHVTLNSESVRSLLITSIESLTSLAWDTNCVRIWSLPTTHTVRRHDIASASLGKCHFRNGCLFLPTELKYTPL